MLLCLEKHIVTLKLTRFVSNVREQYIVVRGMHAITYPHEDENFGVSNSVFALRHSHHGEL